MTKKNDKIRSYAEMHERIPKMNESQLRVSIEEELNSDAPRRDMLQRMIGRFNRLRAARFGSGVLGLLGRRGTKSLDALLGSNR